MLVHICSGHKDLLDTCNMSLRPWKAVPSNILKPHDYYHYYYYYYCNYYYCYYYYCYLFSLLFYRLNWLLNWLL